MGPMFPVDTFTISLHSPNGRRWLSVACEKLSPQRIVIEASLTNHKQAMPATWRPLAPFTNMV